MFWAASYGVVGHMWRRRPDSLSRCQTTSTLRFPNNNSPHFAPNLRHIYSFNLSSRILRLSGIPGSRHSSSMTPREDQRSLKRGGWLDWKAPKSLKKRGERTITVADPVTTEVVQSPEIRQTWSSVVSMLLPCFPRMRCL